MQHGAPNSAETWVNSAFDAAVDTEAVVVETEAATDFTPEALVLSAKFQCGWYQYVHRWASMTPG